MWSSVITFWAPDIAQCPAKSPNSEAFGKHRHFLLRFFFNELFNRRFRFRRFFYIQNCKMCLSKKILYQYFRQISFLNGVHTILQLTTVLLEKICNPPPGKVEWSSVILCVNINISWGLYPQAEPLDYRLNICVTVCLWIARFESICLFSNSWKLQKLFSKFSKA